MLLYVNPHLFTIKVAIIVMYQNTYSLHKGNTTSRALPSYISFSSNIIKEAFMTPKRANSKFCWGKYCTYTNVMYVQYSQSSYPNLDCHGVQLSSMDIKILHMYVWHQICFKSLYIYWTTNGHTLVPSKKCAVLCKSQF